MNKVVLLSVALAGLVAGGCATVEISSAKSLKGIDVKGADGKADRAIMVANEGYYFFHALPIVSGDVTWNARAGEIEDGISFFSNQIDGDHMINAMERYAESRNCELTDIVVNNRCTCNIGLFGVLDWFNTIIAYQGVTYSGVLRPRN